MKGNLAAKIWLLVLSKKDRDFFSSIPHLKKVQEDKLLYYLQSSAHTSFGKDHELKGVKNYPSFTDKVPVTGDISSLGKYMERMRKGESDQLFPGKADFFESTSGSSGPVKYIPFNKALKEELSMATAPWMWEIKRHFPGALSGKFYWSVSPPIKEVDTAQADSNYFNPAEAFFLKRIFAVPETISAIRDPYAFYMQTWVYLLQCPNLSFISCWSPVFLIRLVEFYEVNQKNLQRLVGKPLPGEGSALLPSLFPNLKLISCWTSASSSMWLPALRTMAGNIPIQGKGLLATEGVSTIPVDVDHCVLSYRSHFYEFRNSGGGISLAIDLEEGKIYEVILTTGGGLWRYSTGDLVRCEGFHRGLPQLAFMGRKGAVSDMVGEKLAAHFVENILVRVLTQSKFLEAAFLQAVTGQGRAGYEVLFETGMPNELKVADLLHWVEKELMQNPYYKQAVILGQLDPLRARMVEKGFSTSLANYYMQKKNMKEGNMKPPLFFEKGFLNELL